MDDGDLTSSTRSTFKPENDLTSKLPAGGSTIRGTSGLTQRAESSAIRHSTKGLTTGIKPLPKLRPMKNLMKSVGRKRGF